MRHAVLYTYEISYIWNAKILKTCNFISLKIFFRNRLNLNHNAKFHTYEIANFQKYETTSVWKSNR